MKAHKPVRSAWCETFMGISLIQIPDSNFELILHIMQRSTCAEKPKSHWLQRNLHLSKWTCRVHNWTVEGGFGQRQASTIPSFLPPHPIPVQQALDGGFLPITSWSSERLINYAIPYKPPPHPVPGNSHTPVLKRSWFLIISWRVHIHLGYVRWCQNLEFKYRKWILQKTKATLVANLTNARSM